MKTNSFRLKIAALSGMVSAGLLIATGAYLWHQVRVVEMARVDRELRSLGHPQLDRVNGRDHWLRFEEALSIVIGPRPKSSIVLWVRQDDRVLHRSQNWPTAVAPETLSGSNEYESPLVVPPGETRPPPPRRSEPISPRNPGLPRRLTQFHTITAEGTTWRLAVMGNPYVTLVLGANLDELDSDMIRLRNALIGAMLLALALVGAGSWWVANRALRPIRALTQTAEGITAQGLGRRIPSLEYDHEMDRLVTVFNQMLDRLERSFHQATRFSADAAHELTTPLTILQGELEQALTAAETGSEHQNFIHGLLEEILRLKAITQKLMLLARADAGQLVLERKPFDLSDALVELADDAAAMQPAVVVEPAIAPRIRVSVDSELLLQAMRNLLTNAAKYNRIGGEVRVELTAGVSTACIRIGNTGSRIPAADRDRVFERFYRGDPSRSQKVPGTGLGLSLAREIARAHGGELELEPASDDWTWFRLELPLANESA